MGAAPRHARDDRPVSYTHLTLPTTKKEGTWLIAGWLAVLVVLPLLMSYGVMPLLLDDLGNYSNISPYFLLICSPLMKQ